MFRNVGGFRRQKRPFTRRRGAWCVEHSNPPARGVLPLDPAQEAPEQEGIEETSHSPWIAIAVFYNTGGDTMQEQGGKGQLHQTRGSSL